MWLAFIIRSFLFLSSLLVFLERYGRSAIAGLRNLMSANDPRILARNERNRGGEKIKILTGF